MLLSVSQPTSSPVSPELGGWALRCQKLGAVLSAGGRWPAWGAWLWGRGAAILSR